MPTALPLSDGSVPPIENAGRSQRPAWRQRLIQAERGFACGLRSDSIFYVHFFGISLVLAAGMAFSLELWQWVAITLSLTVVLSAEMFQQGLKLILKQPDGVVSPEAVKAISIGTAAVLVACIGSVVVLTMIFVSRAIVLFGV